VKGRRGVPEIARRKQLAAPQRLGSLSHQHAVHNHIAAYWKILCDELMFCGNIGQQQVVVASEIYKFALAQIGQRNENVVSRVELQNAPL
jgi:hypothetical protein